MSAPIHIEWFNRAGGSGEYGAHRIHGKHAGFDSYTLPKATIYGTAAGGVVIGKGYVSGGWGHYVDVRYPGYTQRDCHMNEASGLRVGAPASTSTALGRVGRTGNAANIFWVRNGVELWHVHSEVYLAQGVQFNRRTNPLPMWGASTAGGGITVITEKTPEHDGDTMLVMNRTADNVIAVYDETHWQEIHYLASATSGTPLEITTRYVMGLTNSLPAVPYNQTAWDYRSNRAPGIKRDVYTINADGSLTPIEPATATTVTVEGLSKADLAAAVTQIIGKIPTTFTAQ